MSVVHAQVYVRASHLHVEARLPHCFTAEGLTLEIAPATRPERFVGTLCSIRHDARWTLGSSSGSAIVDLLPAASDLTELIVQTHDEARTRRGVRDRRQTTLCLFLVALRRHLVEDRSCLRVAAEETPITRPWRTPA